MIVIVISSNSNIGQNNNSNNSNNDNNDDNDNNYNDNNVNNDNINTNTIANRTPLSVARSPHGVLKAVAMPQLSFDRIVCVLSGFPWVTI